jgi:hypothetical protein
MDDVAPESGAAAAASQDQNQTQTEKPAKKPRAKKAPADGAAPKESKPKTDKERLAALPIGSAEVPRHQLDGGYEVVWMDRRAITEWEQNPRYIEVDNLAALRGSVADNGLVEPSVVFNKRFGPDGKPLGMVSGHQRLKVLDKESKTGHVYQIQVSVVDLDEDKHVEVGIALNNAMAQGGWNFALLGELLKRPKVKLKATGFSEGDFYTMFGASGDAMKASAQAMNLSLAMEKAQERQTHLKQAFAKRDESDYYLVFVFRNGDDVLASQDAFSLPMGQTFVDGAAFLQSNLDWLATRGSDRNRDPEEIAITSTRVALEVVAPIKAADKRMLSPEAKVVLRGYVDQMKAALDEADQVTAKG